MSFCQARHNRPWKPLPDDARNVSDALAIISSRLDALRRQSRRDHWTGMACLVILGVMLVPFIYAAWRLFCAP